ncbi:MAG: 23S rRNA (pseudouridine(1915)-N(3))-methyltransferase RlmH [Paludibacteraceae bacterium]
MKIKLILVGKTTDDKLNSLIGEYTNRLKFYISFEQIIIAELKNAKSLTFEQQKEKEGELILSKFENGDDVILLDEKGKELTSVDFAKFISNKMLFSNKSMVFVVGGPYGFSPKVYQRANSLLSLSKMTFSHQMIRLLFAEQLYRAMTIIRGEPYHHE